MAAMAKLSQQDVKAHLEACALAELDRELTEDERLFVLTHWHEAATTLNTVDGAFFTPLGLARDLSIEVHGTRVLDLGAGIGRLSWACRNLLASHNGEPPRTHVCVERNPAFVAVGRRVLPEAEWICADVFDLADMQLDTFDTAISNPPYGRAARIGRGPRYRGRRAEYHVIDIARDLARLGAFIVPATSAPFRYSGQPCFTEDRDEEYERFERATGVRLEPSCGIDTSIYLNEWRGVSPQVEVVTCDFADCAEAAPAPGEQLSFASAVR
jgi:SAM-dependent methyltransferase